MIYTACYFEPKNHNGLKVSISQYEPKKIKVDGKLHLFVPDKALLIDYKNGSISNEGYVDRYRSQMRRNLPQIHTWLDNLDPQIDMTLLCWERAGEFCHRNLAIAFVERYRSKCFGGKDLSR
jgi:hypothetical protein